PGDFINENIHDVFIKGPFSILLNEDDPVPSTVTNKEPNEPVILGLLAAAKIVYKAAFHIKRLDPDNGDYSKLNSEIALMGKQLYDSFYREVHGFSRVGNRFDTAIYKKAYPKIWFQNAIATLLEQARDRGAADAAIF